jgi:Fe-S cluster assembly iron-binding protein IscA
MIQISDTAQTYFRKLIEREAVPGMGVRLSAVDAGTPRADARLEFAEPADLLGDEWAVDCDGFTLYVAATSVAWMDGADIDIVTNATGGQQLTIKAPKIKGDAPSDSTSLVERVRWVVENEVNPAAGLAWRQGCRAGSLRRRRGAAALRRWLPGLRHGRRDPQAGHREDPDGACAGHHRSARRDRP